MNEGQCRKAPYITLFLGKFSEMKARSKALLLTLCAVLLVAVSVLGTMAYLTSKTQVITNTFTVGNINIELTETKPENQQAKIIPGVDIVKDPKVTVKANSEACYLFLKVEQTGTFVKEKVNPTSGSN